MAEGNIAGLTNDNNRITTHELHMKKANRCQLNNFEVNNLLKSNKDKIRG
ncbi:MAG: hypothetical protein P9X26_05885 [Candidatus Stygibacter frigidus]|nr:hypothetical protein [Candidatus Stygibacter frigidus]